MKGQAFYVSPFPSTLLQTRKTEDNEGQDILLLLLPINTSTDLMRQNNEGLGSFVLLLPIKNKTEGTINDEECHISSPSHQHLYT